MAAEPVAQKANVVQSSSMKPDATASAAAAASTEASSLRKGRQFSLERDVYYFNNRREEVVTYEAGGIGKKLGSLAAKQGLSEPEAAMFKRSMGDLCAKLMTASRTTLNSTSSEAAPMGAKPVFKELQPSLSASGLRRSNSNVAARRGLTPDEQAVFNKSMGDLAGKLMSASRGHLAYKPTRGSVDNVSKKRGNRKHE